jgi:transposase
MMLALLIYCYATGRFGSRTIETASYSDVAVRYNLKRLFVLKNLATEA